MNTTGKTLAFVGGGIGIIAITIFGTLGIQSWQKDHAIAMAVATPPAQQLAQVIAVTPHMEDVQKTSRHCYPVQHVRYVQRANNSNFAGTALGGVAGGLLGSQIGKGHGRDAAIAGGAVLGALAGGNVQKNMNQPQPEVSESLHCSNQTSTAQVQKGYDVTYLYNNQQGIVRMDSAPVLNSLITPPVTTVAQPIVVQQPVSTVSH